MKVFMFNHSGSHNRGCEAIVRGSLTALEAAGHENSYCLSSHNLNEDCKLSDLVKIKAFEKRKLNFWEHIRAYLDIKIFKSERYSIIKSYSRFFQDALRADVCLSVGGDSYCYGESPLIYILSEELIRKGKKVFLWGASVGSEDLSKRKIENLSKLTGIFTRESLSYKLLKDKQVNKNLFLHADPAFLMEPKKAWGLGASPPPNTVGINISPLVEAANEDVTEALAELSMRILSDSDMNIALLSHVDDDRISLERLSKLLPGKYTQRIFWADPNLGAREVKYYISKLRFLITARTHAAIAAYDSAVPCLVLAYSVKAEGIGRDILGSENFVLDIRESKNVKEELEGMLFKLLESEEKVRKSLTEKRSELRKSAAEAGKILFELMSEGR